MKTKLRSTSVDEKTYNKAHIIAKQEFRTVSGLLRYLLYNYIKQYDSFANKDTNF